MDLDTAASRTLLYGAATGTNDYNCTAAAECGCVPQMFPPCLHYNYASTSPLDSNVPSCHNSYPVTNSYFGASVYVCYY